MLHDKLKVVKYGLAEEERVLTVLNYVEFLQPDSNAIYMPRDTVTPSEQAGMKLSDERLLRHYGCTIIKQAGVMLRLP